VKTPKIKNAAVTSAKVEDFGLRLHDLGGKPTAGPTLSAPRSPCLLSGAAASPWPCSIPRRRA
jgi:hypothetical protein